MGEGGKHISWQDEWAGPRPLLLVTVPTRGSEGMLLQKSFEILGITRCFHRHFGSNFQMSCLGVNTCSGSKLIIDIKI